uniref:Uncharacterized protein n=1 Tax=Rhizophora mucronata TaxID=61149 RepID=A0A2P2N6W2_RHIMU
MFSILCCFCKGKFILTVDVMLWSRNGR